MRFLISTILFFYTTSALALTSYQKDLEKISLGSGSDSARLHKLFKRNWDYTMRTYPEWATYVGYPGQDHRWTDRSEKARHEQNEEKKSTLKAIRSVSKKKLGKEDAISYDLFLKNAELEVEGIQYPQELLPINQMGGMHIDIADLMWSAPKNTVKDYENRIERLKTSPQAIEQVIALMKDGIKRGITQPKVVLQNVPSQFDDILKSKVEESAVYLPFTDLPNHFSKDDTKRIQSEARDAIEKKVYPALRDFKDFFVKEYLPACRNDIGFSNLPNGANWYAYKARFHTTVSLAPEEIHNLGLKEVARIRAEMEQIKEKMDFRGDLAKFNTHMKTSSQFFFKRADEMMLHYRDIAKRIDPELSKIFGKLPRLQYGVREMPAYKAPSAPTAYYQGGSLETGRPGYFEANTYDLKARPKWQMEALTLHEAVPGHHLQIAIAQEIDGLPEFRKNTGPTAFIEGWGLYAESLGADLGMYQELSSKYGQLTYEMWRAIRLVVDTGIHAQGWTRDQVINYFKDNSPISEQQIINETDRYIADPGQALAYKIGELKFKELKQKAREKMGNKFSIREFHDQLLGSGALPLDIIETKINNWMAQKR